MKMRALACLSVACILSLMSTLPASAAKPSMTLRASLKGMNEVGLHGDMRAHGTATVRLYASQNMVCYTIVVMGMTSPAVADHIHAGRAGKNGNILVQFPTHPGKSGHASGCVHGVKSSIISNISHHPSSYYVNVHSSKYPAGAVRGQLGM